MNEQVLTVDSELASDLVQRIANSEERSITDVVERALKAYALRSPELIRQVQAEPAALFYRRMSEQYGVDVDLAELANHGQRSVESLDL